ncbi:MAG: 5,5-dehydrodivanillate O-demethylase oxygenase subunit [Alphaproteobacteria bacterium]|jgi:5,5'-dehydrodivanillate O-demethylase|nr:5,5-dehydrodivanillate O-demethylase oxygenase subunit [Alphaproteobacteria bacterium]
MTTQEQNDRLTRVASGTPMGNLLRRYWQPIGTAMELEQEPVQKVRLFGENLTLFRSEGGEYGLVGDRCPHRCLSMEYGIPEERGLRCAYHGWLFDPKGRCLEQPFEDRTLADNRYRDKVTIKAYPVEELGGLIFAYLGPAPVPLVPRWDILVREDVDKVVEIHRLPCNWLQCMENAADPVHFEFLHAAFGNYQLKKLGRAPAMKTPRHVKIEFDRFEYGIMKRRLLEGESPDVDDWTTGHPLLFPNILAVGSASAPTLQFRVPVDDAHTIQFAYRTTVRKPDAAPRPMAVKHTDLFNDQGKIVADNIPAQDMVGWVGQGAISDRTQEHLAGSDKGVVLYRKMLLEQAERVERGEEPMAVIRDRAENEPMINIRRERRAWQAFQSQYTNIFGQVEATIGGGKV